MSEKEDKSYKKEIGIVAENFRKIRKSMSLTQEQLANDLELDRTTIAAYEQNGREMPLRFLFRVCQQYGIPLDRFFTSLLEPKIEKLHAFSEPMVKYGQEEQQTVELFVKINAPQDRVYDLLKQVTGQ